MQFSSEIISIYFVEKPEKFEDYHFIDTDLYNLKNIKELFFSKISDLYQEIHGTFITEKTILNILAIDPLLYNFKSQKEFLLFRYSRIYEILKEFLEKIDREPDFLSLKEITKRKKYSIQKLKEKYKFLKKNVNTPEHKEEISLEKNQNNKRAVDDPRWKNIEKSPVIDWDMVFKTFGPNMVIRILLRRQDYKLLKQMIEEKKIHNKED